MKLTVPLQKSSYSETTGMIFIAVCSDTNSFVNVIYFAIDLKRIIHNSGSYGSILKIAGFLPF